MHRIKILASCITLSAVLACARPPASSTPADADAIRRATEAWAAAIKTGDVERMVAPFTADAMILPPDQTAVSGLDAIRSWSQQMFDGFVYSDLSITVDEVEAGGDWAFSRGVFDGTLQPKAGGTPSRVRTKYILIWRRQPDGSWKISRDLWNVEPQSGSVTR